MNDRQVLELRGPKAALDERHVYAAVWEEEPAATGTPVPTAVLFLTNHECPFRCVMCDLWVNTLDVVVAAGSIPAQIRGALAGLPPARQVKLYNAGSYFDPKAVPPQDDAAIAELLAGYDRVVVESHPAFLAGAYGERCLQFRDRLAGLAQQPRLEIAIGLETAHEPTLARLNKRMTVETFRRAAEFVVSNNMDLRVFVLLNPPYMRGSEADEWACRSIDVAAECGATVCAVIPTRGGNGAIEALGQEYERPQLPALERVIEYGLQAAYARASAFSQATADRSARHAAMRVFADTWDLDRFFDCACSPARASRLRAMNRLQRITAPVAGCACDD
jgi:radical SAM enzyme (TIGR01210 family)